MHMPALTLRRAGFAATLLCGVGLLGSGLHGVAGVNTTLELADSAARPSPRSMLVSDHHPPDRPWRDCEGRPEPRRLT
jgi:hypothetical protein